MKKIFFLSFLAFTLSSRAQFGNILKAAKKTEQKEGSSSKSQQPTSDKSKTEVSKTAPESQNKTQGITSPTHSKYMNKIAFSSKSENIAFQKENESGFGNDFTFGDEIYFRVYMDNSLGNYLAQAIPTESRDNLVKNGFYNVHFFLDNVEINTSTITALDDEGKSEWTSFKGALNNGNNGGDPILRGNYSLFLTEADDKLSNGIHKVRIEIHPCIDNPTHTELKTVAVGEFNLTVKPTSINTYDEDFCLAKPMMSDPKLEARVMKKYAEQKGNSQQTKLARITSEGWTIVRNEYTSVILRRYLNLVVVSINKDGKYVYKNCQIVQEYISGKFEDAFSYSDDPYEARISSRCFK